MAAVRRFKTLEDTRKALAAFLRAIEKGTLDKDKGRVLIYGCNTMASLIRDSEIEARLEALENGTKGDE
ncbi:hypothetical protein [Geothrix terrae]|uniref:hypothetical protein n=1 Tax=Geothrix terrae TaxID=2922720 RepID=UPI001FAD09AC|nr:hypothetical protein [Geothrix terrae]